MPGTLQEAHELGVNQHGSRQGYPGAFVGAENFRMTLGRNLYFEFTTLGTHQPIRKTVTPEIPDKLYFRIGDVSKLCEVPAYVLRFWETEFPQLKPNKGGTGQRLYRKRDVEMAMRIKSLLYDQGYTIPGARQVFKTEAVARQAGTAEVVPNTPTVAPAVSAQVSPSFPAPIDVPESTDPVAYLRQQTRLVGLRDELRSILATLSRPAGAADESKIQVLRPRLFVEPRPSNRLEPARLQLAQRDLFAVVEPSEPAE